QGCDILRTGWTTAARRCPVHSGPLELCFDETDHSSGSAAQPVTVSHDDNRIRWLCDRCVGSWFENHFLYTSPSSLTPRLIPRCPACESPRVGHECVPACCTKHACLDCGATFAAEARVLVPGIPPIVESPEPIQTNVVMSRSGVPQFAAASGWT